MMASSINGSLGSSFCACIVIAQDPRHFSLDRDAAKLHGVSDPVTFHMFVHRGLDQMFGLKRWLALE